MAWFVNMAAVALAPAAMIAVIGRLIEVVATADPRKPRHPTRTATPDDLPTMLARLSRLDGQYVTALSGKDFAQAHRAQSLRLAYDQTLAQACTTVGVGPVPAMPLSAADRVRLEAALARQGLQW